MRLFVLLSFTVLVLAGLGLVAPAWADDSSKNEEARKQFDAGVKLFEAGEFEGASIAFARAYELRPSYKILYLVGKCENEQHHFALSLDAYSRYLAEAGDEIDDERRAEVKAEVERLGALVGTIDVQCPLEGATVYVDDERKGETPLPSPIFVDLGKRTVVVKDGGKELHREIVTIAGGQEIVVKVEVDLPDPAMGQEGEEMKTPDVAPKRSKGLLIGGIAALAAGVGAGVVGGVFSAKRSAAQDDMEATRYDPSPDDFNDAKDREKTAKTVSIVGYVGSGVLVAAGVVLMVLYPRSGEEENREAVSFRPTAGGLAVEF